MESNDVDETSECKRPRFNGRSLPPSLYSSSDGMYSVGDNSVTLFSLKQEAEDAQADKPVDITLLDEIPDMCDEETPTPLVYWIGAGAGRVHPNAVQVSHDLDGGPLFVGRACVEGDLLPGKVAVNHQVCYVAYEGREKAYRAYEVLVVQRGCLEWVSCKDGEFPAYALRAGLTLQGKAVYCVRARVFDVMTPGMLVSGEKECRISYDMKEFTCSEYEVLVVGCLNPKKFEGALRYVPDPV